MSFARHPLALLGPDPTESEHLGKTGSFSTPDLAREVRG